MRRFIFRSLHDKQPTTAAEPSVTEKPFDWSETELDALSEVSKEDVEDTSRWLKRIGQDDAAALFDAESD